MKNLTPIDIIINLILFAGFGKLFYNDYCAENYWWCAGWTLCVSGLVFLILGKEKEDMMGRID